VPVGSRLPIPPAGIRTGAAGMKPAPFVYHAPRSLADALATLAGVADDGGRVLAGGQSLVPAMALRLARPAHLVDINGVAGLDRLAVEAGTLVIGACVRHAAFERPAAPGALGAVLARIARHIAHYPIRTRGTFCGSLAHADPASEWCLAAVTLDATLVASSVRGTRAIAADDFFQGTMTTALASDEVLVEVRLPLPDGDTHYGFCEFSRRAGDFAAAMALVALNVVDGRIAAARIGAGAVEDRPCRIAEAEACLVGRAPDEAAAMEAADAAARAVHPQDDERASAGYRRDLVRTMVLRALREADAGSDRDRRTEPRSAP